MAPENELYRLDAAAAEGLVDPVLLVALDGYVDAGNGVAISTRHLLGSRSPEHDPAVAGVTAAEPVGDVVATFDADRLIDYRSRRPALTYSDGAFTAYAQPHLTVRRLVDASGQDYLLLSGPEPDLYWEQFCAAVIDLAQQLHVRLVVGLVAIPMAVPHTRPAGMSRHATRPGLVVSEDHWMGTVTVPGHVVGLLEYRMGEVGLDAIGLAAHVPHYLARSDHPFTAQRLLQATGEIAGLDLDPDALNGAVGTFDAQLATEIEGNTEITDVVAALEQQYDTFVSASGRGLLAPSEPMPTADELAEQVERFLADQDPRG